MKLIIAGSREGFEIADVFVAMEESGFKNRVTEVVSGTARGVDRLGEAWAKANYIPIRRFPADWDKNGRAAGHIRNREMGRSEEHTSELQSRPHLVCRLLLEKKKKQNNK